MTHRRLTRLARHPSPDQHGPTPVAARPPSTRRNHPRIAPPPTSPPQQPVNEAPTPSGMVPLPTLPFPSPPGAFPTLPSTPSSPIATRPPVRPIFALRGQLGASAPLRHQLGRSALHSAFLQRRITDGASLACGNHKSAQNHKQKLILMSKDKVEKGWLLLLPNRTHP
jgi:hypothetical protein